MLTLFTIPKAFTGHTAVQQRNAIGSWLRISPSCEVILFGDDPGVAEAAAELGAKHVPHVETSELQTPLLSSAFSIAQQIAANEIVMYVNADIILFPELLPALGRVAFPQFLLCGRRRDLDLDEAIDFSRPSWAQDLRRTVDSNGRWHGISGLDYFAFRRGSIEMPPFAVGRPGWDNWLIFHMRRRGIPVLDASAAIEAVHQNHDFSHSRFGEKDRVGGPEFQSNVRLAGGRKNMLTLWDADWLLTAEGPRRPALLRTVWTKASLWYPMRVALAAVRSMRS